MAHDKSTKQAVRNRYVNQHQPLTQAAESEGVAYNTARNWKSAALKAGDDWDIARAAKHVSKAGTEALAAAVIDDFVVLFQSTIKELTEDQKASPIAKADTLAKLADSYAKTMKAAGAANPALSKLGVAMEVLELLVEFIEKHEPSLLQHFVEVIEPFGATLTTALSK